MHDNEMCVHRIFALMILPALLSLACAGPAERRAGSPIGSGPAESPRTVQTINADWTFNYLPSPELDETPAAPAFDDATWSAIALPHTWSTFETTRETHPFIRNPSERDDPYWWHGWGWYRRHFTIDPRHAERKIFIEFDGVQKYARIYLNGRFVGEHKGGFTSFYLDLGDRVVPGQHNVLAVAVSNRRDDDFGHIPPMTAGNWDLYGGIYRDVRLVIKDRLHIPFQGSADHDGGVFITTPEISAQRATVRVRTWLKNEYGQPAKFKLVSTILDPGGHSLQRLENDFTIEAGALNVFEQLSDPIANPLLWSPEQPNVCRVISQVYLTHRLADASESPFGFRWFRWNHDEDRLYLNGRRIHLHGTNRHQEYPWLGDAIPHWLNDLDLNDIRTIGFNFIRTAHYPQDPRVYDLADRLGIVVCEEVPNIKKIDFGEEIQARNLREMIRRDRNHPSIVMWSMGNETTDAADSAWARREDDTRLIYARHVENDSAGGQVEITDRNIEMENLLRCTIRGWYSADEKNLEPRELQQAGTMSWHHASNMLPDNTHQQTLAVNGATWLYADHGADREYKNCPLKHLNPKGWVDAYRVPKYKYYQWQANYTAKPMVFVHPHYWRQQYLGRTCNFVVDSNCDEVELRVNGRPTGRLDEGQKQFHCFTFKDVTIERGTLEAIGRKDGKTVRHILPMPGAPFRVVLESAQHKLVADRAGIAIVRADIVDDQGVPVLGANNELNWEVEGPAKLAGPERYQSDRDRAEQMEGAMYIDTPVCNVLRTTAVSGKIVVRVSSPGLRAGTLELEAVPPAKAEDNGIGQPTLDDTGRQPVSPNPKRTGAEETPAGAIRPIFGELKFDGPPESWREKIDQYLRKENPAASGESAAYGRLLELYAGTLRKNNGTLIADDFNFAANNFNDYLRLAAVIDRTGLDPGRKASLKRDYAERMIGKGQRVDPVIEKAGIEQMKP